MNTFKRHMDGSLTFPHRGEPPKLNLPGYVQDPLNPFRWVLALPECQHRFVGVNVNGSCNCEVKVLKCRLLQDSIVSAAGCRVCTMDKTEPVPVEITGLSLPCDTRTFPTEVWIAGKGPSLDRYDWSTAGWCRIGINEAAYVVPNCLAASGTDNCILDMYAARPPKVAFFMISPTSYQRRFQKFLRWDCERGFGSGPATIETCIRMGAKKIHLIGFDSLVNINGYAKSLGVPQKGLLENVATQTREAMKMIGEKYRHVIFELYQ